MKTRILHRIIAIALALVLIVTIAPVSFAAQTPKLNLKSLNLTKSTSFTLRVLNLSDGETATFKSTNTKYVTVSSVATNKRSCEITGKAVGSAKIKVNIKKDKKVVSTLYCKIKVTPLPVSIKFTKNIYTITEGNQAYIDKYLIIKPNTANETPVYESSDDDKVSVRASGLITAISPGTVTIKATLLSTGLSASIKIKVEADPDDED